MNIARAAVGLLVVTFLLAGTPTAAEAATRSVTDRAGGPVEVDVVRARVTNDAQRLVVTVTFRDLEARVPNAYVELTDLDGAGWTDMFIASRWSGGRYRPYVTYTDELGFQEFACDGIRTRWSPGRRGTVRFVVPRPCTGLGDTVVVRAGAALEGGVADRTRRVTVPRG